VKSGTDQQSFDYFRNWGLKHWGLVNRLARRRFADDTLAEEAALWVLDQFEADGWRALTQYRGGASLKSYFSSIVYNRLEDFSRKRFGRVRPPLWLRKLGGIWLHLYRLLCLERFSYNDAIHRAADRFSQFGADQLESAADRILGEITDCGRLQVQAVELDEAALKTDAESAPSTLEEKERELFLAGVYQMVVGGMADNDKMRALGRLSECRIELTAEERLLLKLCHRDGYSVTDAGRKIGLNRFQVHGKMRRLYRRIRETFERAGCRDEIQLLLD